MNVGGFVYFALKDILINNFQIILNLFVIPKIIQKSFLTYIYIIRIKDITCIEKKIMP